MMDRDLQDSRKTETTEMIETTRGCLTHPLLSMDATTIKTSLVGEMTVEVATTVDRGTMAVEDTTEVAEEDETTATSVVEETEIVTKVGMIIANTTVSIAMAEGQEVREMTIEDE